MITILTLANKATYLPDALASVEGQTRRDFDHVVELDDGSRDWGGRYPPAVFYNEQAAEVAMCDYIIWLSDDDLMLPRCVELLAGYLDAHPRVHCVYGKSRGQMYTPGQKAQSYGFWPKVGLPIYDAKRLPGFKIDSGQFMIRRRALARVPYPYAPEASAGANRADGHLLNNIARAMALYPIDEFVTINRITPDSSHRYNKDGKKAGRDWRKVAKYGE